VEGRLKTRKYTDKDGVEKFATDIIATEMQLLGGREGGATGGGDDSAGSRSNIPTSRGTLTKVEPGNKQPSTAADWSDDDVPF